MTTSRSILDRKVEPRPRRLPAASTLLCGTFLFLLAVAAIAPSLLSTAAPTDIHLELGLQAPSWGHIFGTDQSGRDLYTRVVFGARQSLLIGLGATGVAMLGALVFGGGAALGGKVADRIFGAIIEVNLAFPVVLLALLVVAVRGLSVTTLILAVGIGSAPGYARMVRGQILAVRTEPYIEAARALGHGRLAVIGRHILPNALRPLLAIFALGIGQSIVWASGLSFLGLGVPPPAPEWGALLDAGRIYITTAWWLEIIPGLIIALAAVSIMVVSRAIQRRLEGVDA